jgi:hypothetical protein
LGGIELKAVELTACAILAAKIGRETYANGDHPVFVCGHGLMAF